MKNWPWSISFPLASTVIGTTPLLQNEGKISQLIMTRVLSPSGGSDVSARLCHPVSHRRVQGVSEGSADALWALGLTTPVLGYRPYAKTPLAAASPAAVCSGDQDDSPAPASGGEVARGVRHPDGDQAGPGSPWLADQHGLHRAR